MPRIETCLKVARVAVQDIAWPVLSGLFNLLNDGITALQDVRPGTKYEYKWSPKDHPLVTPLEGQEYVGLLSKTIQDRIYGRTPIHPAFGTTYDPFVDDY